MLQSIRDLKNKIIDFHTKYKQYPTELICNKEDYIFFCRNLGLPTNGSIILPVFNTFRKDNCDSLYSIADELNIEDALTAKREELIFLDIKIIACVGWILG